MKKCPTCERTFDDTMRFCQTDGTPLVEDVPVDPYKTMVASSDEIAAAMNPPLSSAVDKEPASKADDEVLQLPPETDPKKTMYASEEEIRKEMARDEPVVDLPPLAPDPPKFSEPELSPPSFGGGTPTAPPSPFSASASESKSGLSGDPFQRTTPPIPSPFDDQKPSTYEPPPPRVADPEPIFKAADPAPFEQASGRIEASAASPIANWEHKEPMQNAPVSAGPQGQNKTLAIISLVTGILGVTLCCGLVLPSLVATILGFMARGKANRSPNEYGGSGLALGGIITGILGIVFSIAYLIFLFFLGGMQLIMQGSQF